MMEPLKISVDSRFGPEFQGEYALRQITQGEYEEALYKYVNTVTGRISKENVKRINAAALWKSLIQQPSSNPITLQKLLAGDLPYGLVAKLQVAFDKINGLEAQEQAFLSTASDEEDLTLQSQDSGSARSSAGP
jgi:hypothetical protein